MRQEQDIHDTFGIIGSCNWTENSRDKNFEISVLLAFDDTAKDAYLDVINYMNNRGRVMNDSDTEDAVCRRRSLSEARERSASERQQNRGKTTRRRANSVSIGRFAEGEKQAEILRAEGQRQSDILTAEGDQQAQVLRAQGFSTALDQIYNVAQNVDTKTLSFQYFETLKEMGRGDSTKFIFPMEFTKLLGPFASALSLMDDKTSDEDRKGD